MSIVETVTQHIEAGGFFMLPIAIVCLIGVVIATERVVYLAYTAMRGKRTWQRVLAVIAEGRFDEAAHIAVSANCAMGEMLARGLDRLHRGRRRDDIEKSMEKSLDRILPRLERHTHYLVKFGNLAILLGLLGTLVGFIGVFASVGELSPADQADLFAAGVAGSVTPAAFGLIVAIPLLLIHTFLQTLTGDLMDHFEFVASGFADSVAIARQRHADQRGRKPDLRLVERTPVTASA